MAIIDYTYFKYPLAAPLTSGNETAEINHYIDFAERKYLQLALGDELYNAFISGLAEQTPAQKWTDIVDGADFTTEDIYGRTIVVHWPGLANTEKQSFLANFAYYHLLDENKEKFGNSFAASSDENTTAADARAKLIKVWNMGVDMYGTIPFYQYNFDTSSEIGVYQSANVHQLCEDMLWNLRPTLFNFLYHANKATPGTYPNWTFTELKKLNIWGI